jgi:hypothetical protein
MPRFAIDNAIVIVLGMFLLLLVYAFDFATHNKKPAQAESKPQAPAAPQPPEAVAPARSYLDHPFIRISYWYFFGALACVLIGYCLLGIDDTAQGWPAKIKELVHPVSHVLKAVASNVANLSLLIAGAAYARGRDFDPVYAKTWLWIYAILIALWATCWELLHHTTSLFLTLVFIAPDVLLANLALIFLGWVFFSRWSGVGTLYFIIAALYALLQLPARLALDLKGFFEQHSVEPTNVNLEPVFYLLAVGKIFLIGGFVLIVRKVTDDIEKPCPWPTESRTSPYPMRDAVLALIFAFVAALVVDWGREVVAGVL